MRVGPREGECKGKDEGEVGPGAEAETQVEAEAGVEAGVEVEVEGSGRASRTASGLSVTRLAYQRPVERRCSTRSGQRMDMPIVEK